MENYSDISHQEIALQGDSYTPQDYPFQGHPWSAPIQSPTESHPEDSNNSDQSEHNYHIPQTPDDNNSEDDDSAHPSSPNMTSIQQEMLMTVLRMILLTMKTPLKILMVNCQPRKT